MNYYHRLLMPRRRTMTKADVVSLCREAFRSCPEFYRGDVVAQREYFNDLTDSLCTDGVISKAQYERWTNPF